MITTLHGDADRSADGRSLVYCPIPVRPRKAGCDNGPLMMGASAGAASGAGIRFCKTCIRGAPKPPRPNPLPKPAPCATVPVGNSHSYILVVQPAQNWHGHRATDGLDGAGDRCILVQ